VRLAIDDFGTGYSSLAYLRELPVHELKLDRSFVTHLRTDQRAAAIVRSTVQLAHELNMIMVAEGVEDAAVLARHRLSAPPVLDERARRGGQVLGQRARPSVPGSGYVTYPTNTRD